MTARAWAEVDLGAIRSNVEVLLDRVAPAAMCAVVKAGGYGHGAVEVASAALEGGATWLGVAQVDEADALRAASIDAPILLLAEPRPDEVHDAVRLGLRVTAYTPEVIEALGAAAASGTTPVPVHLKVDTGMRRVGAAPDAAPPLAILVHEHPGLELEAVWTHCAVADELDDPFTAVQLERYEAVLREIEGAGIDVPLRHAANSAAAIAHPATRYDLVRCGIAIYGVPPASAMAGCIELVPAVRFASQVSFVKPVGAGDGISYGLHHHFGRDTVVATVPAGYADGVWRRLGLENQDVLIGGRRCPIVGVVTMDQLMVDCGPETDVTVGDEVVLLGAQGDDRITPDEWAERLGTIAYEVVCAIGPRVERRYTG